MKKLKLGEIKQLSQGQTSKNDSWDPNPSLVTSSTWQYFHTIGHKQFLKFGHIYINGLSKSIFVYCVDVVHSAGFKYCNNNLHEFCLDLKKGSPTYCVYGLFLAIWSFH